MVYRLCGSAGPAMASTNERSKNPVVAQSMRLESQLVFSICWNPKGVVSNASEGMDLQGRARASRQTEKASFFMSLYRLPAVWLRLKVNLPISTEDLD